MKIKYTQSIKYDVDDLIDDAQSRNAEIEYIELNANEYIQFLEEINDIQRILIINPTTKLREYRGIRIKVLT